jgi:hypothetical protein
LSKNMRYNYAVRFLWSVRALSTWLIYMSSKLAWRLFAFLFWKAKLRQIVNRLGLELYSDQFCEISTPKSSHALSSTTRTWSIFHGNVK